VKALLGQQMTAAGAGLHGIQGVGEFQMAFSVQSLRQETASFASFALQDLPGIYQESTRNLPGIYHMVRPVLLSCKDATSKGEVLAGRSSETGKKYQGICCPWRQ
jgi:hypothetical protein